jgi:hypothetical protein
MSTQVPSRPALDPAQAGPEYWAARRALWLSPRPGTAPSPSEPEPQGISREQGLQRRLIAMLDEPGAEENDELWAAGLQQIWKGLIGSAKVKHPLPLRTVVRYVTVRCILLALTKKHCCQTKLLHTGWLRDGTWPKGVAAPSTSSDEEILEPNAMDRSVRTPVHSTSAERGQQDARAALRPFAQLGIDNP